MKKLKLTTLSASIVKDKEAKALWGGNCCSCSCYWEGKGGSTIEANEAANYKFNGTSVHGCNQYEYCEGEHRYWPECEHA